MALHTRLLERYGVMDWLRVAFTPARFLSLAFLTLGGFLAGVLFWGGFNTALKPQKKTIAVKAVA